MLFIAIYIGCIILAPLVCWVLWFIAAFFYSYIAGNELEEGQLNYFSMVGEEGFIEVNMWGWLLWPLGVGIGAVVSLGFVLYSIGCWLGSAMHFNKINLTERINNSVRSRNANKNKPK